MTNEHKESENNSCSNSLTTQESFCSECKNEIAIGQNQDENTFNNNSLCSSCKSEVITDETQNKRILMKFVHEKTTCSKCEDKNDACEHQNAKVIEKSCSTSEELINELFAAALDDNEEILKATQSLSQISLSYLVDREENQFTNAPQLAEHNYSSNVLNTNHSYKENDISLHNDQENELNEIDIEENIVFQNDDDTAMDNIFEKLDDKPKKKSFYDQEVQTEVNILNKENESMWDPEFLSGAELEKIDNAVKEATITSASKCKRKLNFDDIDSKFKVAKKIKNASKSNYNGIVSTKLNREKYLADLANDLYELSSYLQDIGKAMNVKEYNNKTSMKIPAAPKIVGYDIQFDCLNQNRFSKLPINIENDSNKFNSSNESSNSKQRVKSSSKKALNGALALKNAKVINNTKGVGVPKKNFYQTTLKEAFSYGKENKKIQNSNSGYKISVNKTNPTSDCNNINRDDKSFDSTSMYDFNPLRSSTFIKRK